MSLADQLLGYSSDEDENIVDYEENEGNDETAVLKPISEVPVQFDIHDATINLTTIEDITIYSKCKDKLEPVIHKIEAHNDTSTIFDYEFMKICNTYIQDITTEISIIHNYIKLHYNSIFPELDSLVPNAVEYAKTVKVIGNDVVRNVAKGEHELSQILPKEKLLVITMSSSLKQSGFNDGADQNNEDISNVLKASDLVILLSEYHTKLTQFVAANLQFYAPNLSNLIGSSTTAHLISAVGSLQNLATTPSCNLAALGNKRQTGIGYGSQGGGVAKFQGYLYETPIIQEVPDDVKKQAIRMFSGKIILCARIDLSKSSQDGHIGVQYKNELLDKLEKLIAPPDQAKVKALPIPIDQKSKKRGGKRFSKQKKNFQSSDLQKLQNKMSFGEREESYTDAFGHEIGLGMAAKSNNGAIRMITQDSSSTSGAKAKMGKKMAQRVAANNGMSSVNDDMFLSFDNPENKKQQKSLENGDRNGNGNAWYTQISKKRPLLDDLESSILKKLKK